MNKVFYINLGGHPLSIDEDAYEHLDLYIQQLERHFKNSEGKEEIISDIETRIAELCQEQLKGRQIVSIREIKHAIEMMGTPEAIEGEADTGDHAEQSSEREDPKGHYQYKKRSKSAKGGDFRIKPGKRLFRNPDDKIIGGVASGISVYFGIPDPIWVRILFAILFFSGFGVVAYLVLWAIMPEARTSADRLAMRGEPINIDSIAAKVEEQLDELSDAINDIGKGWKNRKR